MGGIHGDEPEGARLVHDFIKAAETNASHFQSCVLAIPNFNPDGLKINERTNGRGVDLNRNFPVRDWSPHIKAPRYNPGPQPCSENETKFLVDLIKKEKPYLLIHCHTYLPQICYTGERSKPWAEMLGRNFPHPVTPDIGYPTPGSLGQYCDLELEIPCLCLELPENVEQKQAWEWMGQALMEIAIHGP